MRPTYFYVDLCTRGQEILQERCRNFNPDLAPRHGACQGTSTSVGPSARDTIIPQRGTSLRVWFLLERGTGACRARGWKYQRTLYSMEISLVFSSLPRGVTCMYWRRLLRSVLLIVQKLRLTRGLPCNQFVERRQRTKSTGATNKVTCLFCHQEKIRI